jgi:hypothetical protein
MSIVSKEWISMLVVEVMVPCISGELCRFDWSAIAALGGWLGATATFSAAWAALWISTVDIRDRGKKEQSNAEKDAVAAHVAFVSLAPLLHRAQADIGSVVHALIGELPDKQAQQAILKLVEGVDAQLQAVQRIAWKLNPARAIAMTGIVARAGMVVRQVRRIAVAPDEVTLRMTWAIRDDWTAEARALIGEILAAAEESRSAA